jgi:hypothetical protein
VVQWLVIVAVGLVALAGWLKARSLARRLEQLTQQYWDLRYQHGELRAVVRRLDPEAPKDEEPAPPPPAQAFIPIASLRRTPGGSGQAAG